MIPSEFEYARPATVGETLRLLREREGEAKVLSGGYSLIPLLKLRLAQPVLLVDIRDVDGLGVIAAGDGPVGSAQGAPRDSAMQAADGELRIGARVTHAQVERSDLVARDYPLIADAARGIGDRQVRNWGTVGGSLAHADPSADWPAVVIALGASIVCRNVETERIVPAREWFVGVFQTALEPDELLTEIRIPHPGPRSGGAYEKLERRAGDFATVGVAAQVRLDPDGRIAAAGIGVTGVGETAFAATAAEETLAGKVPDASVLRAAGEAAAAQAQPASDGHGPADYKRAMTSEMTVRALRRAIDRAGGRR